MQRTLLLVSYVALALAPACFFDPSLAPRDGGPTDGGDDGGDDGGGDDGGSDGGVDPTVFTAITAGTDHVCALLPDTRIQCWGNNDNQQLGAVSPPASGMAVTAFAGTALEVGWTSIAAGVRFT